MAKAIDAAKYILEKMGSMSAMKLQKLLYYSQAWALVWDDAPIFDDEIEAWANGPVVRSLYERHRGMFRVDPELFVDGNVNIITAEHKETIDIILRTFGDKSAQWLSDQTHAERPWIEARRGMSDSDRGDRPISLEAMAEYYGSL